MKSKDASSIRKKLFRVGVLLKGADAFLEIAGGLAASLVNRAAIARIVAVLTQDEAEEHSRDFIVNVLRHQARRILFVNKHFLAFYLLGHGVAKGFAVVALIRNKLWAYPVAIGVFSVFIVYQTYRGTVGRRPFLLVFTLLDLIVVILIWLEYREVKAGRHGDLE